MFDSFGNLPAGLHDYDMHQVKGDFVDSFPYSNTRPSIYAGLSAYRSDLQKILPSFEQVLDGSFVTSKNDPNDVDCFISVDAEVLNQLSPNDQAQFRKLVDGKGTQSSYLVDAYLCPYVSQTHPNYDQYRQLRKYWMGEFGFDRDEKPKGLVKIVGASPVPTATP